MTSGVYGHKELIMNYLMILAVSDNTLN